MIHLTNISFGYKKNRPLFANLNLKVEPGNIYGLLGKNGAGKTTLMKLMAGLIYPKHGTLDVMGFAPQQRLPRFLADVYFIHEEHYVPKIKVSTYEKIYAPFYPNFDHAAFENHLSEFGLDKNRKMTEMSYGQKKKVLLSFGLACNARLLILDEPTNGLDIPSKSQFRKLLAKSITEERTFIVSTHQVRDMANLIDPIIILEDGEIIFQQNLYEVSKKLFFDISYHTAEPEGVLHAERLPGAYRTVSENFTGEESEIELEALFNTIIFNREKISELFQNPVHHES
ncbi:MAG: ABC transporter ATP-binding protein [Bacteroidota bacterium]